MYASRRDCLRALAGGVPASVSPLANADEPPPETTRIRIQDAPIACFAPLYLAEALLKAEGFTQVDYVKVPLAEGPNEALAAGRIDIAQNDTAAHMLSLDAGAPIVVLAGIHTGCWELFAQPPVRSLLDLKGKTIAAPERSSRQAFVAGMIASVGLDPHKDVIWINHAPDVSMRLFEQGKIDAFMGFVPEPQELRARKIGHVLLNTQTDRPWSQYFCCLAAGNREFVRKYPIATRRALRALLKATDLCVSSRSVPRAPWSTAASCSTTTTCYRRCATSAIAAGANTSPRTRCASGACGCARLASSSPIPRSCWCKARTGTSSISSSGS